jgi:hypothetical protein
MKFKRLTAALASALLLWGSAYAQQRPDTANVPENSGATAPGVVILELQGAQPTAEETLAMQLLLLQLLMMQSEAAGGEAQIVAPQSLSGTGI